MPRNWIYFFSLDWIGLDWIGLDCARNDIKYLLTYNKIKSKKMLMSGKLAS